MAAKGAKSSDAKKAGRRNAMEMPLEPSSVVQDTAHDFTAATAAALEQAGGSDFKRTAWANALKKVGVPFARHGTKAYEAVWKVYKEEELPALAPATFQFWSKACMAVCGEEYCARESKHYLDVRTLYEWMLERVGDLKDPYAFSEYRGITKRSN